MEDKFISALITLFFLDDSSEETEKKTDHASWPRTFIYLLLFLIFGIFFLRTFQVSTIVNNVTLTSLRGSEDSLHHSTDTVENVMLINIFEALGSYKNPYFESQERHEDYESSGGLSIRLKDPVYTPILKDRSGLTDEKKHLIDSLTGVPVNSNTGSIYQLGLTSTTIPSLMPFFPSYRVDIPKVDKGDTYSSIQYAGNIRVPGNGRILVAHSDVATGYIANGISAEKTIISYDPTIPFETLGMPLPLVNTMNILTAADLSQYTYCIELHSDMYVKSLSVAYNIPIEMINQSEGVVVSANGFGLSDPDMINTVIAEGGTMMFLVKMPTMANLQQIRSLILTAIVTAFFSLFCKNLFYRFRKRAREYIKKKNVDSTKEFLTAKFRVDDFKFIYYTLSISILVLILFVAVIAAHDYVFFVDYERDTWIISITWICIIVAFSAFLYYFYFSMQKSKNRKGGSDEHKEKEKVHKS